MEIGAQLYTVRAFMKTKEDLLETFKKIADIGYKNIQLSGACEVEGEWLDEALKNAGLKCVLTHNSREKLTTQAKELVEYHNKFGCDYLGLGQFSFPADALEEKYAEFVDTYRGVGENLAKMGKYFMYHNHAPEFQKIGGETIMQKIANDFAPEHLGFTLDTYWVQFGGTDLLSFIEKLNGRIGCVHLKDYMINATVREDGGIEMAPLFAPVGDGTLDFPRIVEKMKAAGAQYFLVEQDNAALLPDPLGQVERSIKYLKQC